MSKKPKSTADATEGADPIGEAFDAAFNKTFEGPVTQEGNTPAPPRANVMMDDDPEAVAKAVEAALPKPQGEKPAPAPAENSPYGAPETMPPKTLAEMERGAAAISRYTAR